jgi:hypothetical protein
MSLCKRLLTNVTKITERTFFKNKPYYNVKYTCKKWIPHPGGSTIDYSPDKIFDTEQEADKFIKKLESKDCDKCGHTGKCTEIPKRFFDPYD